MSRFFLNRTDASGTCCDDCQGTPCDCQDEPCVDNGSCPRPDNQVIDCDTGQPLPQSYDLPCCSVTAPNTMIVEEWWQGNANQGSTTWQDLYDNTSNWSAGTDGTEFLSTQIFYKKYVSTYSNFVDNGWNYDDGIPRARKPCKSSYCEDYLYNNPFIGETERSVYFVKNCIEEYYSTQAVVQEFAQGSVIDTNTYNFVFGEVNDPEDQNAVTTIKRELGGRLNTGAAGGEFAGECDCGDTRVSGIILGDVPYNKSFVASLAVWIVSIT